MTLPTVSEVLARLRAADPLLAADVLRELDSGAARLRFIVDQPVNGPPRLRVRLIRKAGGNRTLFPAWGFAAAA